MPVRVEVWSDVVCPWCYVGKRRLEKALARFEHADEVEVVVWRSFQLEPTFAEGARKPVHEYLAEKFGTSIAQAREMTDHVKGLAAQEGLAFDAGRAWMVNTLDAHRVAHLAKGHGLLGQMHERLMRAHHIEGAMLDDPQTLVRLADEVGVPGDEVRRVLAGDEYAEQVREDIRRAAELGATGVPFFVLNGGDEPYAMSQLTGEIAAQSGKPVAYQDMPGDEYAKVLTGFGLPEALADLFAGSDVGAARGDWHTTSRDLSTLIDRPTTTLAQPVATALDVA